MSSCGNPSSPISTCAPPDKPRRGQDTDPQGAQAVIDPVAGRDFRYRYRTMATSLAFEGHIAAAQVMT
jgi:hypothetical protein